MIINSVFGVSAKIVHTAIGFKWCCCNAYQLAALVEFSRLKADNYNIYADDNLIFENQPVVFMGAFNSKYGGGGMKLSPYSVLNDGMIELLILTSKATFGGLVEIMDDALKREGIHGYREDIKFIRAKKFKIENLSQPNKKTGVKDIQRYGCDGEDLFFREFVSYETLQGELEVIVDYDYIAKEQSFFPFLTLIF